jgi:PAS domain S-box-containing protein
MEDITEQTRAEQIMRQERDLLRTILDNVPVMINYFDADGKLVYVNRGMESITGWSVEDARQGDALAMFYPDPEYRQQVTEFIQRAEGAWSDFKTRVREGRTLDTSWTNIRFPDGTTIGIGIDITERKRAEEALRASEARYRTLVEHSPLGIATARLDDFRILQSNPALCQLLGYTEAELTAMTVTQITHRADREADVKAAHAAQAGGQVRPPHEQRLVRKDGSTVDVWVTAAALPDACEGPRMAVAVLEDITARKREEAALRDSRTQSRTLAARVTEAEEVERRRLARELHDQVGQNLTALSLSLNLVHAQLSPSLH